METSKEEILTKKANDLWAMLIVFYTVFLLMSSGGKNWGVNLDVFSDKQLPAKSFSRICCWEVSGFDPEVKRNERGKALSNCTTSMATGRSLVIRSGSTDNKTGESNSRSTVTSEYTQRQENLTEVSGKPYDQKSQLPFRNSTSLRKSCVVKRTLRVDINGGSKKSRAHKSSFGKSSVGSYSNPVSDGKDAAIVNPLAKNRCRLSNVSRKSTVHMEEPKLGNRLGTAVEFAKPTYCKATKSLEHIETPVWADLTLGSKSGGEDINDDWFSVSHLFRHWSSHQLKYKFSKSGEEIVTSELDLAGKRNENTGSVVSAHQTSSERDVTTGGLPNDQRITERNILQNRAGSTALQEWIEVHAATYLGRPIAIWMLNPDPSKAADEEGKKEKGSTKTLREILGWPYSDGGSESEAGEENEAASPTVVVEDFTGFPCKTETEERESSSGPQEPPQKPPQEPPQEPREPPQEASREGWRCTVM